MASVKNILIKSYFGKLIRKDRLLFVIVLLFISLSVLSNIIRLETSPFFVWNMYAERYYPRQDYDLVEVRYNDNMLLSLKHTWMSPQQMFLTEPLFNYLHSRKIGGEDPARDYLENHWAMKHPAFKSWVRQLYISPREYQAFPSWYKAYLSSIKN
jgi:hypothetical protein